MTEQILILCSILWALIYILIAVKFLEAPGISTHVIEKSKGMKTAHINEYYKFKRKWLIMFVVLLFIPLIGYLIKYILIYKASPFRYSVHSYKTKPDRFSSIFIERKTRPLNMRVIEKFCDASRTVVHKQVKDHNNVLEMS